MLALVALGPIDGAFDGEAHSALPKLKGAIVVLVLPQRLDVLPALLVTLGSVQCSPSSPSGVWTSTCNVHSVTPAELATPSHAGPWGLSRSARSEAPLLDVRCADVGGVKFITKMLRVGALFAFGKPSWSQLGSC